MKVETLVWMTLEKIVMSANVVQLFPLLGECTFLMNPLFDCHMTRQSLFGSKDILSSSRVQQQSTSGNQDAKLG
jgi:hypothetical protein